MESIIVKLSRDVWARPAVGLQEQEAMELHIRVLEKAGFQIVSRRTAGHPTAFVAEWQWGRSGPKIGFLPEYDALPGLGNTAEPIPRPTPDGDTDGHGCGHNCLGAGCTGAALALKKMMEKQQIEGTLRVYGCGAEENVGAKVFMAKAALFDDLDAALAWHSAPVAATGTIITSANRKIRISWKGRTAHAGNSPWDGRSALDAAELFAHGVNLMREHLEPTARLHYVFERAGVAPNIVPDEAQIWLTARDITSAKVDATVEWLGQLAEGAALGTQTKATFSVELGLAEMIPNETLSRRVYEYLQHQPFDWTSEEQSFAKACQKQMGLPETGLATRVLPFIKDMTVGASTDVGDVSWIAPIAVFGWPTLPQGVTLHSWPVTACGGMSIGDKGTLAAASILTAVGYDLLTNADFRNQAIEELQKRLDGRKYTGVMNLLPEALQGSAKQFAKGPGEEYTSGF
ncbi:MAG: amidohydrolase [Pirellula sp.]|jgi:aminobenzoyl-glutamate utilization protein B|nr:amidohydrolase [Pirellula sp.]